jgi:hypothetical protein
MSGPLARRDNHVNFNNKYLLMLGEEYTDEQAARQAEFAITGEVLWAPKRSLFLRQGEPGECRRNSGRSELALRSSLRRRPDDCEPL